MAERRRKTLIYIASDARSGSTLLDQLLANNEDIESVGEMRFLNSHLNHYSTGHSWNWRCTCEKPLEECNLWAKVIADYREQERSDIYGVQTSAQERFVLLSLISSPVTMISPRKVKAHILEWLLRNEQNREVSQNYYKILDSVCRVTGKNIVLDSSKNAGQLYNLIRSKPNDYEIKLIHLIRDGRAVGFSKVKRASQFGKNLSFFKVVAGWLLVNMRIMSVAELISDSDRIIIKYEDLCSNTEETIRRICARLNIDYRPEMGKLTDREKHNIGGSQHRFTANREIKLDRRWEKNLSSSRKLVFFLLAGWFSRKLGY